MLDIALGTIEAPIYGLMAVTFYYGIVLLNRDAVTPGVIVLVAFSMIYGSGAVGHALQHIEHFNIALNAAGKIFFIIDRVSQKTAYTYTSVAHLLIRASFVIYHLGSLYSSTR